MLAQAERRPTQSGALVREAAAQAPAAACPAARKATVVPSRESVAQARREMQALRTVTGFKPQSGPASAQARKALSGVLARGEFSSLKGGRFDFHAPKWLQNAWRKVGHAWWRFRVWWGGLMGRAGRFFQRLFRNWHLQPARFGKMAGWVRYLLILVIILAGLLLLGFIASRLLAYWQHSDRQRKGPADGSAAESPGYRYMTPWDQALGNAEACWARGEQREALRIVLRACLALLDGRGVLRYDESWANGEVLRELRRLGRNELHAPMRVIVRAFDRGWYGFLTITGDEFAAVLDTGRQLRTLIREEP
jgi:hypothetical protein